ncbi:MAG: inorganic phosphate transporter [Candidatus Paceibacterota bacterium]
MVSTTLLLVIFIIVIALIFDFTNGIHDSANSIATIVSTRVLSPRQAVCWAAFFNFIAFLVFGTGVASTIGKGLIDLKTVTPFVVLAGLLGAIIWNLITWFLGLPTSSSHALIGGYIGASIVNAGFGVIILGGFIKIIIFIFLAPIIGFLLGMLFMYITMRVLEKKHASPQPVTTWSKRMQLVSAAAYSLGHGGNDAQKTMGIITSLLFSVGYIKTFTIPLWVVLSAQAAIALGTLMGGWRIVKTMGQKIVRLKPLDGVCAETASAISIFLATHFGIPVSTTHIITGAISGVGATKRMSSVRWQTTFRIVWAWVFTIPAAAFVGGFIFFILKFIF